MTKEQKQAAKLAKAAAKAAAKAMPNPVLPEGAVKVEAKVPGQHAVAAMTMTQWQPVEGVNLLTSGEHAVTHKAFMDYPLATSKTGRFTGKLMNIGDFALFKTGKAFVQRQADAIKAETGKVVDVLSTEEKRKLSDEMNGLKKRFFAEAKQVVAAINAHPDAQIQRVGLARTANGGVRMNVTTVIQQNMVSEVEQLRKQLAESKATTAELKKHVNPQTAKKAEARAQEQLAHEVAATVTKQAEAAAAPSNGTPGAAAPTPDAAAPATK